jgi:hypothetical protein
MIYAFRFPKLPGGWWHGIAFAKSDVQLFWAIDQQGDPGNCEVKKIDPYGSLGIFFDNEMTESAVSLGDHLFEALTNNDGWKSGDYLYDAAYVRRPAKQ